MNEEVSRGQKSGLPSAASLGEEAELLRIGTEASDLAFYASSTALLLRGIAKRGSARGLDRLVAVARDLVTALPTLQQRKAVSDAQLPYRQLIPVRVWRRVSDRDTELENLAQSLPQYLDTTLSEGPQSDVLDVAQRLERLATLLREQAAHSVNAVGA